MKSKFKISILIISITIAVICSLNYHSSNLIVQGKVKECNEPEYEYYMEDAEPIYQESLEESVDNTELEYSSENNTYETNFEPNQFTETNKNVRDFSNIDVSQFLNSDQAPSSKICVTAAVISIIQILLSFIPMILFFIVLPINLIKNSKIEKSKAKLVNQYKEEKTEEIEKEIQALSEKEKKMGIKIVLIIIFAVAMFGISGVLSIITNFSAKPIIYLYPETEQEISVELGKPELVTCSYPKYENFWKVKASPNGDLVDLKTGRRLYALYWEGINNNSSKIKEGFCVKGEDSAKFLEEKLEVLGLNSREAEEFIVYWLPKLEKNKYNLIRFETLGEIEENMPLEVTPKPDTLIRVMMEFKSSNKYVDLKEQKLYIPERKGFVVVEWGGTEL